MICLDTNIVISILTGRGPSLRHRLEEQVRAGTKVGMPVVALFEMRFGIAKSDRRGRSGGLLERVFGPGLRVFSVRGENGAPARRNCRHLGGKGSPTRPLH